LSKVLIVIAPGMQRICIGIFILLIVSINRTVFSQQVSNHELAKRLSVNLGEISIDPDKAFAETGSIYKEALKQHDQLAELGTMRNICRYYEKKYDFRNMIVHADQLNIKALQYKINVFSAIAHDCLFRAYSYNGLWDKARNELKTGLEVLDSENEYDSTVIDTRSNLLISFSNYYLTQKDNENRLKYIKLSMVEHNKFKNNLYRLKLQYIDYSNLSTVYNEINPDSAEYYAKKSLALDNGYGLNEINFSNLLILGNINYTKKNYDRALDNYLRAAQIKDFRNHFNVETLYDGIISTYRALGDSQNVQQYTLKLENLKLQVSENKNQSLYQIIDNQEKQAKSSRFRYIFLASVALAASMLVILAMFTRRRIILNKQEKGSNEYLGRQLIEDNEAIYSKLTEMVKKNDLAFFTLFNETFPGFSKKLLDINPKMVQTEIEFCALLKLNIRTKDIARYKNIEHRTVQHKKYLVRKKLNIPGEVDIYYWFNNL
jgi:hypothetical protein